jgi:glutathione S-transferase
MIIYLGNKNYSSWSLRAWLSLKATDLPFEEVVIPLDQPATQATIKRHSPNGRVPALHHDGVVVWDSLAIGEYLAELAPAARLLPEARGLRALARSAVAEMHAGFGALRTHLPMNVRASYPDRGVTAEVQADIDRIVALWRTLRHASASEAGEFLCGAPGIVDHVFAPVVSRFRTYAIPLDDEAAAYAAAVWSLPAMQEWSAAAKAEPMVSQKYEF